VRPAWNVWTRVCTVFQKDTMTSMLEGLSELGPAFILAQDEARDATARLGRLLMSQGTGRQANAAYTLTLKQAKKETGEVEGMNLRGSISIKKRQPTGRRALSKA